MYLVKILYLISILVGLAATENNPDDTYYEEINARDTENIQIEKHVYNDYENSPKHKFKKGRYSPDYYDQYKANVHKYKEPIYIMKRDDKPKIPVGAVPIDQQKSYPVESENRGNPLKNDIKTIPIIQESKNSVDNSPKNTVSQQPAIKIPANAKQISPNDNIPTPKTIVSDENNKSKSPEPNKTSEYQNSNNKSPTKTISEDKNDKKGDKDNNDKKGNKDENGKKNNNDKKGDKDEKSTGRDVNPDKTTSVSEEYPLTRSGKKQSHHHNSRRHNYCPQTIHSFMEGQEKQNH
ncbi:hypothetical protein BB559_001409 [Furculomyces boomerangus]|uniref:Uncharacterized protein n=1 Tax=Furculomyces boomerangus TaxID=61424 RepID=A0A2T9Z1Z2_9FUNG|nr:hypothetical protein BB559_001409 [Furculomyces boomerangus]